jgi:hypothetical protein
VRKHTLSVARLMADIAILAVGLSAFAALGSRRDSGARVLGMVFALVLTVVTDRAFFGRRHRPFWLGFTVAGWLCAAMALTHLQETRVPLLKYGPPIVRARHDYVMQLIAARRAQMQGLNVVPPRVSEWYLLCSLFAELSLGLLLGGLFASAAGLLTAAVAFIARQENHLAKRSPQVASRRSEGP